jgi:hypothetical protein
MPGGSLVQFTSSCRMDVVVDTEVLISEVQSRPIIWNPGNEDSIFPNNSSKVLELILK